MTTSYDQLAESLNKKLTVGRARLSEYPVLIEAALMIKIIAAEANAELGFLDPQKACGIISASRALMSAPKNDWDVPMLRILGAPLNLIVSRKIIDKSLSNGISITEQEINLNQAESDIGVAILMLTVENSVHPLLSSTERFIQLLKDKSYELSDMIKTARTHLRDGLPVNLGDEFKAFAAQLSKDKAMIQHTLGLFNEATFGLGEFGTGLGSCQSFGEIANKKLECVIARKLQHSDSPIAGLDSTNALLMIHCSIQALALTLWEIAHNLGLMCSGPRGGIREIAFPAVAPGSSIMPGKVNPTVAEMVMLVADKVISNQWATTLGTHSGWLSYSGVSTLPIKSVMDSCDLLARSMDVFSNKVIKGIVPFSNRSQKQAEESLMIAKVLEYFCPIETVHAIIQLAEQENISCKEAAEKLQVLPTSMIDDIFNVKNLSNRCVVEMLLNRYAEKRLHL